MKYFITFTLLISLVLFSCKQNTKFDVDISDINIELKVKRFEQDLFKFNIDSSAYYLDLYKTKYGEFFKLFNLQIVDLGDSEDKNYAENLDLYLRFWKAEKVPSVLKEEFSDFEKEVLPDIEKSFRYYKYYFPEKYTPDIYTFFSSFGYSVVSLDSVTGLGIDKYLGKKHGHFYDKTGWSNYQKKRMHKKMIPVDIMRSTAESEFVYEGDDSDNLLNNMLYQGKIQYFLNCMLPETPDTLKWMYSEKQLIWANKHEAKVWNYIAEQKLLFSSEKNDIRKFVGDGPYTSVFTDVSAPRAGVFVGYKIVEKYMTHNPDISLKELMEEKDYQKILAEAKYNP